MYIAFIGDDTISREKLEKAMTDKGAETLLIFPSGQVEEESYIIAKEKGMNIEYDAYASGSYIGGVKTLMSVLAKKGGVLFIAENKKKVTSKLELILAEAEKRKVNYQFI